MAAPRHCGSGQKGNFHHSLSQKQKLNPDQPLFFQTNLKSNNFGVKLMGLSNLLLGCQGIPLIIERVIPFLKSLGWHGDNPNR
jgi:hypothetical protein